MPRARERLGHNLDNIHRVLAPLPAANIGGRGLTAFDQFCGYLVLDALVANRDRHEENWGVLRDPSGRLSLAPSFDHGNSLAFNVTDDYRRRQLERDPTLTSWCRHGCADRFEAGREITLVDFAHQALRRATPESTDLWLDRLGNITSQDWADAIDPIPEMSGVCRTFCLQLLSTNQRRLLRVT